MSWNYRVMKRMNESGEYDYGIHEVFYDEKGEVSFWTLESLTPVCSSEEDLMQELHLMLEALKQETILYKEK